MMNALRIDKIRIAWSQDDDGEGCRAIAEVSYPLNGDHGDRRIEWLSSGGLYGIDEPSAEYRREIENEQLDELRDHLGVFGVPLDGFDAAVRR